jgi:hypothetical protein
VILKKSSINIISPIIFHLYRAKNGDVRKVIIRGASYKFKNPPANAYLGLSQSIHVKNISIQLVTFKEFLTSVPNNKQ